MMYSFTSLIYQSLLQHEQRIQELIYGDNDARSKISQLRSVSPNNE